MSESGAPVREVARVDLGQGVLLVQLDTGVDGWVGIYWGGSDLTWPPKSIDQVSVRMPRAVLRPILEAFGRAALEHRGETPSQLLRRVATTIEGGSR